ncbi:transposase [Spiroplasma ixodetis]|uniref:Transposase n=1 Tax=Spiroplasma ixodetis TaxID=2141 RepID=A0ABN6SX05_9MOLU|nr:transposase [Spiroplasma ixodetis]BDT03408.1 hypothetical protein SHM_10540 [Spiroplasma ixodetis]BDT04065.1 hypothetical protein SHM_17110 [Spiroplasma ixodetis]
MTNINSYTDEFKKQIVALYQSGKSVSCLAKEYNVTRAATYKWIKQFTNSGSFKIKNRTSPHMYLWRKQWNWMSSIILFKLKNNVLHI